MSLKAFSDYLLLEKKYSKHTALAYIRDIETFQDFLNEYHILMRFQKPDILK